MLVVLLLSGCAGRALQGGKAVLRRNPGGAFEQTLVQGENPAQATRQEQDHLRLRTYTVPAGSWLSAPLPVTEREESHTRTELGAAQKDTARELGARLSSFKGIVWVGLGLFVFGLVSLVWPPLRALIGSLTTSAALSASGLALMILPSLVVGHELLLLGGVGAGVGGWFLAHRHGQLSARSKLQTPSSR